jgi:methionine--tRNA ligase beta chain
MKTTGDNSDAALATLYTTTTTVSSSSSSSSNQHSVSYYDWTFHMFCQYVQQTTYQLKIINTSHTTDKNNNNKKNDNNKNVSDGLCCLVIGGAGSGAATTGNVIHERNAIVRSLMGMALHGTLDTYHTKNHHHSLNHTDNTTNFVPIIWNGGYSMMYSSCHSTSIIASIQHMKMIHYMTMASQLRRNHNMLYRSTGSSGPNADRDTATMSIVLNELDMALETTSFLLPYSATPSFVDIDVAVALLLEFVSLSLLVLSNTEITQDRIVKTYHEIFPRNVQRWMIQMIPTIQQLSNVTNVPCPYHTTVVQQLMDTVVSMANTKASSVPLVFFHGTENTQQVLSQLSSLNTHSTRAKPSVVITTPTTPKTDTTKNDSVPVTVAAVAEVDGGATGKKKLTKQDKKAALAAAKAAAAAATTTDGNGGGDTTTKPDATTTTTNSNTTTADVYDVTALDIRIGKIIKIWEHESADKLYCEEIDLGNGEIRQIASGLRPFYKDPNDLLNQLVLVVYNLKKRTLVGFPSHGMVLCASNTDHTAVEIVIPPPNAILGERITFDGLDPTKVAEPESKVAKKKIFEVIAPDLVTNEMGYVHWKTYAAQCSVGPIRAINGMSNAHVS